MECGEQCVTVAGITMMPELCADNWGTVEVSLKKDWQCVDRSQILSVLSRVYMLRYSITCNYNTVQEL